MESTSKSAPPKTHHCIHSSPATATTSRRCATTHVPRVTRYSLASIDTGFVEIGLVQLSQSVKTTNTLTDTQTDGQTDRLMNGTLYAPRYEEAFLSSGKKTASVASLPRPCLFIKKDAGKKLRLGLHRKIRNSV